MTHILYVLKDWNIYAIKTLVECRDHMHEELIVL